MNTIRKRSEPKEEKKDKPCKNEIALGKLLKYLIDRFPDSMIDRIHLLKEALMIQFKALSFAKCPAEKLEKYGKVLIEEIYLELDAYIINLNTDLLEMWEEDKEYRKGKE